MKQCNMPAFSLRQIFMSLLRIFVSKGSATRPQLGDSLGSCVVWAHAHPHTSLWEDLQAL